MGESNVRTKVFDQAMYRQVYKSSVLKTKNSTIFQTIYYPKLFTHAVCLQPSHISGFIYPCCFTPITMQKATSKVFVDSVVL